MPSSSGSSTSSSSSSFSSSSESRSSSEERPQARAKGNEGPITASQQNMDVVPADGSAATVATRDSSPIESAENKDSKKAIDEKALEILGKYLAINKPPGPPICEEMVSRWTEILSLGLPKEDKATLLLKYGTPENCLGINPPKLNPEVKASLTEPITSRDTRLIAKQEKVTVCISALGGVLSKLLCGETVERLPLIEVLSHAEKLLVDLQRDESLTRKALIVANLNASIKDALNDTVMDEWLFGKQLDENIKTEKCLERSSK